MTTQEDMVAVNSAAMAVAAKADATISQLKEEKAELLQSNTHLQDEVDMLSQKLAECQAGQPGPDPTPTKTKLMGISTGRNPSASHIKAYEDVFGVTEIGRTFFGEKPMLWDQMGVLKNMPFISSVKFYKRNLTKNQIRDEVYRFMDAAPENGIVKYAMDDHEKDAKVAQKVYTIQEGVDTTNYFNSLVKAHGHPDFQTVLLLTSFQAATRFPMWTGVDQSLLDVFAFDFYRGQKASPILALAEQYFPGKPHLVGEIGAGIIGGARGTDQERADFIRVEGGKLAASPKMLAMCYFVYSPHHRIEANEPLSRQAWADVRMTAKL